MVFLTIHESLPIMDGTKVNKIWPMLGAMDGMLSTMSLTKDKKLWTTQEEVDEVDEVEEEAEIETVIVTVIAKVQIAKRAKSPSKENAMIK